MGVLTSGLNRPRRLLDAAPTVQPGDSRDGHRAGGWSRGRATGGIGHGDRLNRCSFSFVRGPGQRVGDLGKRSDRAANNVCRANLRGTGHRVVDVVRFGFGGHLRRSHTHRITNHFGYRRGE